MGPGLPDDLNGLGEDGIIVLLVNGLTGTLKEWLETRIDERALMILRRFYVFLPVAVAGALCALSSGFSPIGWGHWMGCSLKYGTMAAYLKMMHRSGWEGR